MEKRFTRKQLAFISRLNTPEKIQDFIDSLQYNYCGKGHSLPYVCKSPKRVLEERTAHCFEGALFGAAALRINGFPPLIVELNGLNKDVHMIAPFKREGLWGCIAQSSYFTLKWRDPIFRNMRELALSFFPVYAQGDKITLRTYTSPINLSRFDYLNWMASDACLEKLGDKIGEYKAHLLFPSTTPIRAVSKRIDSITRRSVR